MGIGEAAGYNYAIPQKFIGRQPQQVQQAPDLPADDSDFSDVKQGDYLAHVEGLSDQYFNVTGLIREFAHDQAKKGIDVTQPDYSQPGGGELFKTYQKLAAVLKHTANDLANSNDIDKTMQKLQAEGKVTQNPGFDPRQQMSATMSPNQMYTSTDLNQTTQNAATDLGQAYYTNADAQAKNQTVRNPLIDFYQKRMQEDPGNAQYYANQIAALPKATAQTAYQQLIPHGGGGSKVPPGVSVLKKITNLSSGVWSDGSYKPVVVGSKTYLENKEMTGESLGQYMSTDKKGNVSYKPKIISRWLKNPDTGEVEIEYQDPEVPNDVVSGSPGSTATNFIANNPKYGDVAKTMDIANSLGILDEAGNVDASHPAITPANAEEIKAKVRSAGKDKSAALSARVKKDLEQLNNLKTHLWGNDRVTYKLPNGGIVEVKTVGDGKFDIIDPETVGLNKTDAQGLTAQEILDTIGDLGVFDDTHTTDPKAKAAELLKKYSK